MTNQQPGLPLEAAQTSDRPKGLVPRSAFVVVLVVGLVALVLYAIYDVNTKKAQRAKERLHAPALAVGAAPAPDELKRLREAQERAASAPAATVVAVPPEAVPSKPLPVPAEVIREAGVPPGVPAVEPARVRGARSGGDRRDTEDRANAERAEAEHRARVLNSKISEIDNGGRADQQQMLRGAAATPGQADPNDPAAAVAALVADRRKQADEMRRAANAQRDGMLQAAARAQAGKPSNAQRDAEWLKENGTSGTALATYAAEPASSVILLQGTRIPAVTLEAVNSDLPGQITARATEDIRDSLTQTEVLVPAGTRFIGRYSADISPGQERILSAFSRMVLPDGRSVDLGDSRAVDGQGQAGMGGDVNNHWFTMFGYSLAIALIADKALPDGGVKQSTSMTSSSATRTVAGEVLVDVSKRVLDRNTRIAPTITAPMGQRIFVTITKDVVLQPWKARHVH
jgi:type IV secretion system protein VirB10